MLPYYNILHIYTAFDKVIFQNSITSFAVQSMYGKNILIFPDILPIRKIFTKSHYISAYGFKRLI